MVSFDSTTIQESLHQEPTMRSPTYQRGTLLSVLIRWNEANQACIQHREFIQREGFGEMTSLNSELRDWTQRVRWAAQTIGYDFKRRKLYTLNGES